MSKTAPRPNKSGFTLVELLVVIIIIAILATIGLVMYGSAQKQARISKRIQDLKAIQTALQLYYSINRKYPLGSGSFVCLNSLAETDSLVPTYMPAIPNDPSGSSYCYQYRSTTVGDDYKVITNGSLPTTEMGSGDYKTQPNLIDPAKDGGECSKVDGITAAGWAIYSSNTGANDATNPACWEGSGSASPSPSPSSSP